MIGQAQDDRARHRTSNAGTRSRSLRLLSDDPRTLARNPAAPRAAITKTVAIETTINITPSSNDGSRRCGWPRPRRSVHKVRLIQRHASARLYRSHATTATIKHRIPDIRDRRGRTRPARCYPLAPETRPMVFVSGRYYITGPRRQPRAIVRAAALDGRRSATRIDPLVYRRASLRRRDACIPAVSVFRSRPCSTDQIRACPSRRPARRGRTWSRAATSRAR